MAQYFSKTIDQKLKILAYYQIAGGVFGIIFLLWMLTQTGTITGLLLLLLLVVVTLYSFSIFCGRLILRGEFDLGLKLSIYNQAIQILSFAIFGYAFKFVAGLSIMVGFDFIDGFNFGFKSSLSDFQISYATDDHTVALRVNLLAAYLIQYISELQEQIIEYKLLHTITGTDQIPGFTETT